MICDASLRLGGMLACIWQSNAIATQLTNTIAPAAIAAALIIATRHLAVPASSVAASVATTAIKATAIADHCTWGCYRNAPLLHHWQDD